MMGVELLAEGFVFPEGPAWSERDQCLYFVDWLGNRVLTWKDQCVEQVFTPEPGGGPSGLGLTAEGSFWLSLYDARKLALYNRQGEALLEVSVYQGQPFRGVCDLVVDSHGGVYFTDSGDFEEDWRSGQSNGAIYYRAPTNEVLCVDRGICFPNGITISPDEACLYVNEHRQNRTLVYKALAGGGWGPRQVFFTYDDESLLEPEFAFELGPDGACLDDNGCLWIAHYGGGKLIQVCPDGSMARVLPLPRGRKPTNLAFCASQRQLYVTEAECGLLYRIDLEKTDY